MKHNRAEIVPIEVEGIPEKFNAENYESESDIPVPTDEEKKMYWGELLHFGLYEALTLKSCGVMHTHEYRRTLCILNAVHPEVMCEELRNVVSCAYLKEDAVDPPEKTIVELDLFADGVTIFENSQKPSILPIYGRIVTIGGIAVPQKLCHPFTISIYYGPGKPNKFQFFERLLKELKDCGPAFKTSGIVIKVRLFIGDTPIRAWMKG